MFYPGSLDKKTVVFSKRLRQKQEVAGDKMIHRAASYMIVVHVSTIVRTYGYSSSSVLGSLSRRQKFLFLRGDIDPKLLVCNLISIERVSPTMCCSR